MYSLVLLFLSIIFSSVLNPFTFLSLHSSAFLTDIAGSTLNEANLQVDPYSLTPPSSQPRLWTKTRWTKTRWIWEQTYGPSSSYCYPYITCSSVPHHLFSRNRLSAPFPPDLMFIDTLIVFLGLEGHYHSLSLTTITISQGVRVVLRSP